MIADYLNRLKQGLLNDGVSIKEAEEIVEQASRDIDSEARELVADAVERAKDTADSKGAFEFLDQITLNSDSGYVEITTDSGQLDFSTPSTPMLPWLLKGAKTSKSGSQYKVIPIGKSSGQDVTIKDVDSGVASIKRGASMADMAMNIAKDFGMSSAKMQKKLHEPKSGPVTFVTASSSQEGTGMWMKRAQEKDMRPEIDEINHQLRSRLEEVCSNVVNKYRSR